MRPRILALVPFEGYLAGGLAPTDDDRARLIENLTERP
jgi:hypothetical protein